MKRISSKNYLAGLRVHFLPIVVWLSTVACVIVLFSHRSRRFEIIGVAHGPVHQIAATCDGRLDESVSVGLYDQVTEGQIVAVINGVLDNERPKPELQARLTTLGAAVAKLTVESNAIRAEYVAVVDNRKAEFAVDSRSFATNVTDAKLRVLALTTLIETEGLLLKEIDVQIKNFVISGRLDANDGAFGEWQEMKARRATIDQRIKGNERTLDQYRLEEKAAEARQKEFAQSHVPRLGTTDETAQEVIARKADVLQREMDEIREQLTSLAMRERVELRAPYDGIISMVYRSVGEAIVAGEPILTISRKEPANIVAYASEEQAARVRKNMPVQLIDRKVRPNLVVDSQVIHIGPTVEQMPARLWRNPNRPQWGRPILIKIPPTLNLVPGAVVGIKGI